jgi:hypothetical protein
MRGPNNFKHTAETDARIRKGYEEGEWVADIAAALGVTRNTVIGRARRIGLAERGRNGRAVHADPEKHARIMDAMHAGYFRWEKYKPKANHSTSRPAEPAE